MSQTDRYSISGDEGIKKSCANGSVLCAVDGNSTANVSAAQMEAYVGGRAAAGAAVKLTLADGGARRTLELRP